MEPARLSALDAAFLALDQPTAPFVVGALLTFERVPLRLPDGALDLAAFSAWLEAELDREPRYRQRIGRVPVLRHPVWVDDAAFDLARHLRVVRAPPPGDRDALFALAGDLLGRDLDLAHPPWELWLVDGLAGGAFAIVAKVHHALVDGVAGVRLVEALLSPSPGRAMPARTGWTASPPPSGVRLLAAEVAHRARTLRGLATPGDVRDAAMVAAGLGSLLVRGLTPAPDVGLNPWPPHRNRRFAGLVQPLARVRAAGERRGATVNDVVLTLASGGLRRLLEGRGVDTGALRGFRAMVPVNARARGDAATSGNRVVLLLVPLPVDEPDPVRRLERVRAATGRMKHGSRDVDAGGLLLRAGDATSPHLVSRVVGLTLRRRAFNVVVTNIPGPARPLYLLDACLIAFHPVINLWPGQSIGFALFSYDDHLYWGLNADAEGMPDLDTVVAGIEADFAVLRGRGLATRRAGAEATNAGAPPRAPALRAATARPRRGRAGRPRGSRGRRRSDSARR